MPPGPQTSPPGAPLGAAALVADSLVSAAELLRALARDAAAGDPGAAGLAAQAGALARRAREAGERNAAAYATARAALGGQLADDRQEARDHLLAQALDRAADGPAALAETAGDVAALGCDLSRHAEGTARADAAGVALIAAGAAAAAAHLVAVNLVVDPGDERATTAARAARDAARAAREAADAV
jgi:formiminotetrahydrofolate cyclodeaminase